jgi:branched-chain amino acid transport system substrate-binding protein
MRMRIDEVNAEGGVHGRKLRLVVEDHGYDPKKAVLAAQKLVQQDQIFAALGSIGTPTAVAAMQIYLDRKVAHLFPLTGAREMFEPLHPLKYSFSVPYYDQIRAAMKRVIKDKNLTKICTLYQDDDYGLEVMRGGEQALKDLGMAYAEKTTYKRGATDFASQVARMKEAGCDGVVMGTIIRETIGTIATARRLDWNPQFVGTTASYFDIIHKLGGAAVNGFYAACTQQSVCGRSVRKWHPVLDLQGRSEPTVLSPTVISCQPVHRGAKKAGKDLNPDTLAKCWRV